MNFRISGSILVVSAMTLLASLTGCVIVDKNDDTGTAGMSSTSGDATTTPTTGSGTSGTSDETGVLTDGTTVTTEVPTSTDASATGDSTTAGSTTADATTADATTGGSTGGASSELQASCEAACTLFLECMPGSYPDLETCAAECIGAGGGVPACEAAAATFNNCIAGFDCAQLNDAVMNTEFGACTDVFNAYTAACNP